MIVYDLYIGKLPMAIFYNNCMATNKNCCIIVIGMSGTGKTTFVTVAIITIRTWPILSLTATPSTSIPQ